MSCSAGKLVGYDKHMNLLLSEVTEEYSVRLRVQRTKRAMKWVLPGAPPGRELGIEALESGCLQWPACYDCQALGSAACRDRQGCWRSAMQPHSFPVPAHSAVLVTNGMGRR